MSRKENSIVVYWSPADPPNWNVLYEDPKNCYHDLLSNRNKDAGHINFFSCPSFKDYMKNTFVIKNPITSHFHIEDDFSLTPRSKQYIKSKTSHSPSISNNILFDYGISHYFFCEEDLEVFKTPPFFHGDVGHQKYGTVVPGKWNAGSWIRPMRNEFNLWSGTKEIIIKEDEPITYYYFNTDRKVILKRFIPSEKIMDIAETCAFSNQWEPNVELIKRYRRFKQSKTNKIIINEIKKNLIE